jgi:hypothetical protein
VYPSVVNIGTIVLQASHQAAVFDIAWVGELFD